MASSANENPTFYEIVIEGHFERSHGLLLGLYLGAHIDGRLFFSHEEGVKGSFGERLREVVGLHAPVCHVVCDDPVRDLLERHTSELGVHGLRVADTKRIRSAEFEYSFHAYAPRYAKEIRDLLAGLPKGVELLGNPPVEHVDRTAAGIEVYAPVHEYEFEGKGRVRGRIDLVIEARRRLIAHPLVHAERIELELAG